ncbi:MAG: hypothetical protein PVG08_21160 [Desulfobacterales bacterium]
MIKSILNKIKFSLGISLFPMILIALSGCAMSNYGKLESNREVKQSFETYQILPNHKYYYRGAKSRPTVIVGINENYELNLKLWVQIDPKSEDFRILIQRVSLQGMGNTMQPWGFRILDNTGNYVGVWYSALRAAAVQINENRQIVNLQPSRVVAVGNQRQ